MDRKRWGMSVALLSMMAGCVGGLAGREFVRPAFAQNPNAPKWEQFCEPIGWSNKFAGGLAVSEKGNETLMSRGREGWELILITDQMSACYRRPAS